MAPHQRDTLWMGVLPANRMAVEVYRECQWTMLANMAGMAALGISAQEKRAALLLLRVPRSDWTDTLHRLHVMVGAAAPVLNRKPKEKKGRK